MIVLQSHLDQSDRELRYQIIKALNRLRNRDPGLRFDESLSRRELEGEARLCYDRAMARARTLNTPRFPMNSLLLGEAARLLGVPPERLE